MFLTPLFAPGRRLEEKFKQPDHGVPLKNRGKLSASRNHDTA